MRKSKTQKTLSWASGFPSAGQVPAMHLWQNVCPQLMEITGSVKMREHTGQRSAVGGRTASVSAMLFLSRYEFCWFCNDFLCFYYLSFSDLPQRLGASPTQADLKHLLSKTKAGSLICASQGTCSKDKHQQRRNQTQQASKQASKSLILPQPRAGDPDLWVE